MAGLTNTLKAVGGSAGEHALGFQPQQCKEKPTDLTVPLPTVLLALGTRSSSIISPALPSTALRTGADPRGREVEVVSTVTQFRNDSEAHSICKVFMALKAFQGDSKHLLSCRCIQIGILALTSSDGL